LSGEQQAYCSNTSSDKDKVVFEKKGMIVNGDDI